MQDVISSIVVILFGFLMVAVISGFSPQKDRVPVLFALAMHFGFAIASYWIMENIFFISDVHAYVEDGQSLHRLLDARPIHWGIEFFKLLCRLPNELTPDAGPTERMVVVASLGMYAVNSVWALFLLCTLVSFFGKWAMYVAFRDELAFEDSRPILIAAMLIPSCVYWTSGLVKECFAMAGVGFLFRGAQLLLKGFNPLGVPILLLGFVLVGGFKPFFLFAFVVAAAFWILFAKVKRNMLALAPFVFAIGFGVAIVGIAFLGTQFKEFAVDKVAETVAEHQHYAAEAEGGSNYRMGDGNARSFGGQLAFAPLALFTTLARPLPFEVHNVTSAIACGELLVMTALLLSSLRRSGIRGAWRNIFGRPPLVFAFVFTLTAATAVGLATANFGTLSRYRTPLLPFYAVLIVGLRHAERSAGVPAPVEPEVPPARAAALARALKLRGPRRIRPVIPLRVRKS